jgi:orotidine-5'-phosphate decarboxylase
VPFASRLFDRCRAVGNPIVAGIDPRLDMLPDSLRAGLDPTRAGRAEAFRRFGRELIDVLAGRVPAVKFQAAFYEALGPEGMSALRDGLAHARSRGLLVILDGKRNDIGSTAEGYADAYLAAHESDPAADSAPWPADALTINTYLGSDGVTPFLNAARASGNGLFALVRTSNPSAREFQDLLADGLPLYRHVAARLADWAAPDRDDSGYSLLGAVVGATYPEQVAELRAVLPGVVFLIPGYGAQGGSARDVAAAFDNSGLGAVVNSSRGLAFAHLRPDLKARHGADWQRCVEDAVVDMAADLAANTSAGRLRPR